MALRDSFVLIITHNAIAAQISATGSGQLVAGDDYQVNFTYTKGDPPIMGKFSADWTLPPGATTPEGVFTPDEPTFDDPIYGPSARRTGVLRGKMPTTTGRYTVKITVFQPDPDPD